MGNDIDLNENKLNFIIELNHLVYALYRNAEKKTCFVSRVRFAGVTVRGHFRFVDPDNDGLEACPAEVSNFISYHFGSRDDARSFAEKLSGFPCD